MTEEKKKKFALNTTLPLVAIGLLLLAGIIYFAWNRTGGTANGNNNGAETATTTPKCDQKSTQLTETDKLNANEVAFTACNFQTEVLDTKGLVVVDAYASWCPHCQKIAPIIARIADEYVGKAKVGKLNSNNQDPAMKENFDFAVKNGLLGYPTVWFYKDGKIVDSFSGEKTYDEIKALVDKNL